jgi:hypothetical protein
MRDEQLVQSVKVCTQPYTYMNYYEAKGTFSGRSSALQYILVGKQGETIIFLRGRCCGGERTLECEPQTLLLHLAVYGCYPLLRVRPAARLIRDRTDT